jgi:proteic killer suppression protein
MDILFKKSKLQKICNNYQLLQREFGDRQASLIRRRLDELYAAETLADIGHLPPARCHELTGDRKGQFSVDIHHPYRLLFSPANEPVPTRSDGGIDRSRVTTIVILGVEDTHD